jgi:NADPH2:quinone reductase
MLVADLPGSGGPEAFVLRDADEPSPEPHEVLLDVHAAGINRADMLQREGRYPAPPGLPRWPGLEVSGTIRDVGAAVTRWNSGDQVCALLAGGGYAEAVAVPEDCILPIPEGLTLIEAAGLVEAACTVWSNFDAAHAAAGETVLIHGGSGGVGTVAIQMARAAGLKVIATAGSSERARRCEELGADIAIDYTSADFVTVVQDAGGADVILDVVGAAYLERNLAALTDGGRLVVIGLQKGTTAPVNLGALVTKRASVIGTTLRSRPAAQKAAIVAAIERVVWPQVPSRVSPVIHGTFPLTAVADAHREFESGNVFGKLVLTVDHD